jgi:hypothetical protein
MLGAGGAAAPLLMAPRRDAGAATSPPIAAAAAARIDAPTTSPPVATAVPRTPPAAAPQIPAAPPRRAADAAPGTSPSSPPPPPPPPRPEFAALRSRWLRHRAVCSPAMAHREPAAWAEVQEVLLAADADFRATGDPASAALMDEIVSRAARDEYAEYGFEEGEPLPRVPTGRALKGCFEHYHHALARAAGARVEVRVSSGRMGDLCHKSRQAEW